MRLFPVIGLMSGTSLDGIDASLVLTNGKKLERTNFNLMEPYSNDTKIKILKVLENPKKNIKNSKFLKELENEITIEHKTITKKLIKISNIQPNLIGFHGQTIYHDGISKISVQLGDGELLSKLLKTDVVYQFRKKDLLAGGEGAPISPIYHKLIIETSKLNLPAIVLNIGGITNLSYWDGKNIYGFDTGPGNNLMDHFMRIKFKKNFDKNGNLAKVGMPNYDLVRKYCSEDYFKEKPPKSLERFSLINNKYFYEIIKMKPADCLSTLIEITVNAIMLGLRFLPKKVKNALIVGGGVYNEYLIKRIREELNTNVFTSQDLNLNTNFIEAELIAYLSARKMRNLTSTFPSTTGTKKNVVLGELINFN